MSPLEAARFADSAWDDPLYTTSNSWIEVNYTQLVHNARSLLPQIKPGSIPLAMVKVTAPLAPCAFLTWGGPCSRMTICSSAHQECSRSQQNRALPCTQCCAARLLSLTATAGASFELVYLLCSC